MEKAIFLTLVVYAIIEHLYKPVRDKIPANLKVFTPYVAWAAAAVIVFLSGIDLFAGLFPNPLVGQILTAVLAGCGSELVDAFFGIARWQSK